MDFTLSIAFSYLGLPYIYGGKSPLVGFDCSGLVYELLRASNAIPSGVYNSQALFDYFHLRSRPPYEKCGAVSFYGESILKITHCGFHLDRYRMIESGGGDSTTLTREMAAAKNACVRVRPVKARKDWLISVYPDYSGIGLVP